MVATGTIWMSIFGARTFHRSSKIIMGSILKADSDIKEWEGNLSHLTFHPEHAETFPTHVWGNYICRINENVCLLSVVWLASNYVQCIYFKFRRCTQEISRNKMRRNWQCTEWKKLMSWIIQPVNQSRQGGEKGGECSCIHGTLPTILICAWKAVTLRAAVTSFIFLVRPGFVGHKYVTVLGI